MKVDYMKLAQEYHGRRSDGYLTDVPMPIELKMGAIIKVRFDSQLCRWIPNRPSNIVYPKARQLIAEYRREYKQRVTSS